MDRKALVDGIADLGQPADVGSSGVHKRLDAFRRHAQVGGHRLLDLGCGTGAYTEVLAPQFDEVEAVDVDMAYLQAFRERLGRRDGAGGNIVTRQMPAEALQFPDEHFDAVTCIEVLEHVRSPEEAVAETHRVLRPGGLFLVTVPNRLFPFETHMVTFGSRRFPGKRLPGLPWMPPLHRRVSDARTYTGTSLSRLVAGGGFEEVAIDHMLPPFDRWAAGRKYVKPTIDLLEGTRLRAFGVSVVGVFRK